MTSKNEITGDNIKTKPNTDKYREGWERIFNKDKEQNARIAQLVEASDLKSEQ